MALHQIPQPVWLVIGGLLIILGLSFCYKAWNATVLGRAHYWSGFLPFTLVSPWLIHLPPGERSLIKVKEGLLCHMFIGPLFFVTALPCLIVGADLVGLPGTSSLNFIVNGGDKGKPSAITYSPPLTYAFPIAHVAGKKINKIFQTQIDEDPKKKLLPADHKNAATR
ncbi:MAG: hypothetical protein K2X93_18890 [Candidatus Obscuribacterales bacterium]|nr:hypothetical protein [Candidatus Obscuribacterales bacterium]